MTKARCARNLFRLLLAAIAAGYLFQSFTPLRLSPDALIYLLIARNATHGGTFTANGVLSPFASGYPVVIWAFAKLGLANSLFLNLLNLAGIAAGIFAVALTARRRGLSNSSRRILILASLLSYPMIKDTAIPLSDPLCFGLTLGAVAFAEAAATKQSAVRRTSVLWAASLVLAAGAFWLRMAGLAVFAALLFECVRASLRSPRPVRTANSLVAAMASAGALWNLYDYFSRPHARYGDVIKEAPRIPLLQSLGWHLRELGEFGLNVPQSKFPPALAGIPVIAGILLTVVVAWIFLKTRREWSPARTFVAFHALMVFAFPRYGEPRIWLPVLPLLIMEAIAATERISGTEWRYARLAAVGYCVWFASAGTLALAYSDWLTASPEAFIAAPMNQEYKGEYETWILHRPARSGMDPRVFEVFREFGGRR